MLNIVSIVDRFVFNVGNMVSVVMVLIVMLIVCVWFVVILLLWDRLMKLVSVF